MCLAIYKPAETKPDWGAYQNGMSTNDDGWGFTAVVDGEIVTTVGLGKFEEFRENFEPYSDRQAIIHFRMATDGDIHESNCHPFLVSDELSMIHNGIIKIERDVNKKMSDTWHFCELVLKPLHDRDPDFFLRPEIRWAFEKCESFSKFIFLRADGTFRIWNEDDGKWAPDGHWYSNDSHKCSAYYGGYAMGWPKDKTTTTQVSHSRYEAFDSDWRREIAEYERELEESTVTVELSEEVEASNEREAYIQQMRYDLHSDVGMSIETMNEVQECLGDFAIEALHELI